MQTAIAQLKKLRQRSLREIHERGRQEFAKVGERLLVSTRGEMSDGAFLREVRATVREDSGERTAALIARRIDAARGSLDGQSRGERSLLPSFACRDQVAALMKERFPVEQEALVARAERAVTGRFDLLGFADLSFGDPIDWHLEPISGRRTPLAHWSTIDYLNAGVAGDKKITWELNRHGHFVTLGQAYVLAGDERFAEAFAAHVSSWMDANPPNLGINWASSLELAFRAIAWLWALHLFAGSPHLTPRLVARMLKCLVAHGRHIEFYLSRYFSPNTHLTGEALGLFYLGLALPELNRAAGWRAKGLRILVDELPVQIRRDGVYFEQTTYYQRYTADFYLHLTALARANAVALPPETGERLALALDHLMWVTRPDGTSPLVGDDDGGRLIRLGDRGPCDFRDTLATAAALFDRGDWKWVSGEAAAETLWLLGPEGLARLDGIHAAAPQACSRAFPEGGYFVMRDGWSRESGYALVDCGPHGALACGHAHADALALEVALAGTTWLVDSGTFTYTGDARARDEFRGTSAHNTATVDDETQSIPAGPFSWKQVASASAREFVAGAQLDYFEGSHDGYERFADPVTHTRAVLFVKPDAETPAPSYLVVRDAFRAVGRHRYALHYHFPTDCSATAGPDRLTATAAGGDELAVVVTGGAGARFEIELGWVSECYGRREPAPVGVVRSEGEGPQALVSVITPRRVARTGEWRLVSTRPNVIALTAGDVLDVVIAGPGASDLASAPLASSGALAWGRFLDGEPVRLCMAGGASIETAGGVFLRSPAEVAFCAIDLLGGEVAIAIRGANRFELGLARPADRITVNGAVFALGRKQTAVFADEGFGWNLVGDGG
jgi:hypothetical protein